MFFCDSSWHMKILIQCGDHFENQKRVSLLANALKKMGHDPYILCYNSNKGNIFKINAIKTLSLKEYEKKSFKDKLIGKFSQLKQLFKKDNKRKPLLDKALLNNILEVEGKRRPEITWPSKVAATQLAVYVKYKALELVIADIKPDIIVIWNGHTGYVANILRVICKNKQIPCAYLERGIFPDSLYLDKNGVNGNSSMSGLSGLELIEPSPISKAYVKNIFINPPALPVNSPFIETIANKKIVFFPLQVTRDTNIIMHSSFSTMREVFMKIYNNLNEPNTCFIIRPHPEETPSIPLNFPQYENVIISKDLDLQFWLERADVVVTINSTVGLQALIAKKPMIAFGKSIYSGLSIVRNFNNYMLPQSANDSAILGKYLSFFIENHLLKSDSPFNLQVVSRQLELAIPSQIHTLNSETLAREIKLFNDNKPAILNVKCVYQQNNKVDLTYRQNKDSISKKYLLNILSINFPFKEFNFISNNDSHADIIICDENKPYNTNQGEVSIDIYGIIVSFNGVHY